MTEPDGETPTTQHAPSEGATVRMAIDPGAVRVGVAVTDERGDIALPLCTLPAKGDRPLVHRLAALVSERNVAEIIIGLPLRMDGTEGAAARLARAFAKGLDKVTECPVVLFDERLTTVSAERTLRNTGVARAKKRDVVDQAAATLLLQSYLNAKTSVTWSDEQIEATVSAEAANQSPRGSQRRNESRRGNGARRNGAQRSKKGRGGGSSRGR